MDELRPDALAAEVAAWHNRHPLARRITPAQVQGVGWVALPFVQRPGATPLAAPEGAVPVLSSRVDDPVVGAAAAAPRLRDRAQARAQAPEPGPTGAAAPRGLPQRLQAAARQALQAVLALPVQLRAGWQASRQQHRQWKLRRRALKPAFSEDFIAPLSPRDVARWALRHGQLQARTGALPVREVRPDAQWGRQDTGLVTLYLATAAVEVGSRRARVLLPAAGGPGHTLGRRLMSPQRAAAALGLLAAVGLGIARPSVPPPADWPGVAAAQATWARWSALAGGAASAHDTAPDTAASAEASASAALAFEEPASSAGGAWAAADAALLAEEAASAASGASATTAASEAASGAEGQPAWAEATMPSDPLLASATPPAPHGAERAAPATLHGSDPEGGASTLPPDDPPPPPPKAEPFRPGQRLVRPLDEATKAAARETVAKLRAARGDTPTPPLQPSPGAAAGGTLAMAPMPAPAAAPADPTAALGPVYALTTRPLRTRAESEQVQSAVRALLSQITTEPMLVELMPAGDDWRVVCWPFPRREDAQLARALLLTRGLRLEPVEF